MKKMIFGAVIALSVISCGETAVEEVTEVAVDKEAVVELETATEEVQEGAEALTTDVDSLTSDIDELLNDI
jgi:peptidoglycan hydrolase CwlO-like protein